jgi:cytochrome c5
MCRLLPFIIILFLMGCVQTFDAGENAFNVNPDTTISIGDGSAFSSTEELLRVGQQSYQAQCSSCHGATGNGQPGSSILGSIRRGEAISETEKTMPLVDPSRCDTDCSTAVIAWVADQNAIDLNIEGSDSDSSSNSPSEEAPEAGDPIIGANPEGRSFSDINENVLNDKCTVCHTSSSIAKNSNLVFMNGVDSSASAFNEQIINTYIGLPTGGLNKLLGKASGELSHFAGSVINKNGTDYDLLSQYFTPAVALTVKTLTKNLDKEVELVANFGASATNMFGGSVINTLNDGFNYVAASPTAALPEQEGIMNTGFQSNEPAGPDAVLTYSLANGSLELESGSDFFVDLYGPRGVDLQAQTIEVVLLTGGSNGAEVTRVNNVTFDDSVVSHVRVLLKPNNVFDSIKIIGRDTSHLNNTFTLMEIRAAVLFN